MKAHETRVVIILDFFEIWRNLNVKIIWDKIFLDKIKIDTENGNDEHSLRRFLVEYANHKFYRWFLGLHQVSKRANNFQKCGTYQDAG